MCNVPTLLTKWTYLQQKNLELVFNQVKGQMKPKTDWRAVDSPKKRTNELFLFFCRGKQKDKKRICPFVAWENLRRTNLLRILSELYLKINQNFDQINIADRFLSFCLCFFVYLRGHRLHCENSNEISLRN